MISVIVVSAKVCDRSFFTLQDVAIIKCFTDKMGYNFKCDIIVFVLMISFDQISVLSLSILKYILDTNGIVLCLNYLLAEFCYILNCP